IWRWDFPFITAEFRPFFYQYACAREGLLSFVLLLILHGGEQRLQFEATNPIIGSHRKNVSRQGIFGSRQMWRSDSPCGMRAQISCSISFVLIDGRPNLGLILCVRPHPLL